MVLCGCCTRAGGQYTTAMASRFGMVGTGQDVTERLALEAERSSLAAAEEASRRIGFLGQATLGLYQSMDFESRLAQLAQFVVPTLCDWCAIDILEENGIFKRLAVAHSDPHKVEMAREYQARYPEDRDGPTSRRNILALESRYSSARSPMR